MTIASALAPLTGAWHAQNRLWLIPGEPARHSDTQATLGLVMPNIAPAGGECLAVEAGFTRLL
jgi:hypothetical protein